MQLISWMTKEDFNANISNDLVELTYFNTSEIDAVLEKIERVKSYIGGYLKNKTFSFVTGTGVSIPYGGVCWNCLINECKLSIQTLNPSLDIDYIAKRLFNTNYSIPQIMKDTNETKYFEIIQSSIVCWQDIRPQSTLDAISDYMVKHNSNGTILTFNYDQLHEDSLKNIGANCETVYARHPRKDTSKIAVIHPHGFYKTNKSIVFTNEEYVKAYKNYSNITPRMLIKQLNKTNMFVGNSVCDYEEQKVIFSHFHSVLGSFHMLCCFDNNGCTDETKLYEDHFFLKMGLIVERFSDPNSLALYISLLQ